MAFSLTLRWQALNANALIDAGFDQWVVEKETVTPGVFAPVAPVHVQPPISPNMFDYVFNAATADVADMGTFRALAYNSVTDAYDATPVAVVPSFSGYTTVAAIRADGWAQTAYSDAVVQGAIQRSTELIDKICRQWFEPRFKRVSLDAKRIDQLWVKVPIIAINDVRIDDEYLFLEEFEIYNRHLTHGIVNPDDRSDPRIAWGDGREPVDVRRLYGGGRFPKARKSVVVRGVFGYTELGPNDYNGETAVDSQIPISYGQTPGPIARAATKLAIRYMVPFDDSDEMTKASSVISEKTRDQSYTLAGVPDSELGFGLSGDTEIDKILMMYMAPLDVGVV